MKIFHNIILSIIFTITFTLAAPQISQADNAALSDPQIAQFAYTLGLIDSAAAKQALAISKTKSVREFARAMLRNHKEVNQQAMAFLKKLNAAPEDSSVSEALATTAKNQLVKLSKLKGAAFDRAYMQNEVTFHKQINGELKATMIPTTANSELKGLLQTVLKLFESHQKHAEQLATSL